MATMVSVDGGPIVVISDIWNGICLCEAVSQYEVLLQIVCVRLCNQEVF